MPRPPRLHVPGAFYHVTLRGNHRQEIFHAPQDRHLMSSLFAEVVGRFNARMHAYCYMTNHVHALIQVSDAPLGRLILRVAGRYARTIQAAIPTTGHLFEKRYHAVIVDADEYLLTLLRYIHLNPVRAGLAQSPDDYPWSSHHVYAGRREEPWVTTDFALGMFDGDSGKAVAAYRRFASAGLASRERSPLEERYPEDSRILGGDVFAGKMLAQPWKPRSLKSLEDLIQEACTRYSVSRDALASASRRPLHAEARAWIARQALEGRIASVSAVARALNRDESSVRQAVRRYFGHP